MEEEDIERNWGSANDELGIRDPCDPKINYVDSKFSKSDLKF